MINYTPDPFPLYNYGTTALYTCNQGYLANGTGMRNCTNSIVIDGTVTGVWNGDPVSCECELIMLNKLSIINSSHNNIHSCKSENLEMSTRDIYI